MSDVLDMVSTIRGKGQSTPIIIFTYYNPILQYGLKVFAKRCREVGVDGVLVVDLPPEEAKDYCEEMRKSELSTIFLSSPTTTTERLKLIDSLSTPFIYYISRVVVTGAKSDISHSLKEEIASVYKNVRKSVVIGFGVSTPEQARLVASYGDGVVIGNAIVKIVERYGRNNEMQSQVKSFIESISTAVKFN